jgi:iron complex outermembrane receptor protein
VVNLGASYTLARQHFVQVFSVQAFNLGDRLYRNHLSFLKEIAPEIGRGVRFTWTLRFF